MVHVPLLPFLLFFVSLSTAHSALVAMFRNTSIHPYVNGFTLNQVDTTTGHILAKPNNVQNLSFAQALQTTTSSISYSIAVNPQATSSANTVLVGVDINSGKQVAQVALPFNHVSSLAQGMFVEVDATGNILVVGEMQIPPKELPHATAGDHILYRIHPTTGKMTPLGYFGGQDTIANIGGYDPITNILWAQVLYNDGSLYCLVGISSLTGKVVQNITDPYMAGGMSCVKSSSNGDQNGRCLLIGITRDSVKQGTFERVLIELTCVNHVEDASSYDCALSAPLMRLPTVCIMIGGVMSIDGNIINSVLQNNSATSPCYQQENKHAFVATSAQKSTSNGGGNGGGNGGVTSMSKNDMGWKVMSIDYAALQVVAEPIICSKQDLSDCPVSIASVH